MKWLLIASLFLLPNLAQAALAQPKPTADETKFLAKCNPDQRSDMNGACFCIMQGIESAMPIKEYMSIEDQVAAGTMTKAQGTAKMDKLNSAYAEFRKCAH